MSNDEKETRFREFSFSDVEFKYLANLANRLTGIVVAEHKKDMVYLRLARRLRALKLNSFDEYCMLVKADNGEEERINLANAMTTNLTSFFREGHHFTHLRDNVLTPLIAQKSSSKHLRIWSAGCSSGMEPYSIAMAVKSALKGNTAFDARILATDIDTNMLDIGHAGEYLADQYEKIPVEYRRDIDRINKDQYIQMSDDLKSLVVFKALNLLHEWPMRGLFDAVFCRNVVIYFDKITQKKLFDRIADQIKPDGWLYIGHSENLYQVSDRFKLVGRTIYQKVN